MIVPWLPVDVMPNPVAFDALTAVICTGAIVFELPADMLKVAKARIPSLMALPFIPYATQIVLPMVLAHETPLVAALAEDPAATLTLAMSNGE